VSWQGDHSGLEDFTAAIVSFSSTAGNMVGVSLAYPEGTATYGNCQVDNDNN
jgi:hypothetical protein